MKYVKKIYLFIMLIIIFFIILSIIFIPASIKSKLHDTVNQITKNITNPIKSIYDKKHIYDKGIYNLDRQQIIRLLNNESVTVDKYKLDEDIISGSHILKLNLYNTNFLSLEDGKYTGSNMPYIDFYVIKLVHLYIY